jgi:hypothetical protein
LQAPALLKKKQLVKTTQVENNYSTPSAETKAKHMDPSLAKTLKIKSGGAKRNLKDITYAVTELQREEGRLTTYETTGTEDQVYQQRKVVAEAAMMIPHGVNRLRTVCDDLEAFLRDNNLAAPPAEVPAEGEDAEVVGARAALVEGRAYLEANGATLLSRAAGVSSEVAAAAAASAAASAAAAAAAAAATAPAATDNSDSAKAAEDGDY